MTRRNCSIVANSLVVHYSSLNPLLLVAEKVCRKKFCFCKVRLLLVAEVTHCEISLVVPKFAHCFLQKLLVLKNHSLLLQNLLVIRCWSSILQKITFYLLWNSLVVRCRSYLLLKIVIHCRNPENSDISDFFVFSFKIISELSFNVNQFVSNIKHNFDLILIELLLMDTLNDLFR